MTTTVVSINTTTAATAYTSYLPTSPSVLEFILCVTDYMAMLGAVYDKCYSQHLAVIYHACKVLLTSVGGLSVSFN
jgi:hypothetical protein